MNKNHILTSHPKKYMLWSFLGLFVYVILINAWVTEDAYITFRVVDNLVNGYGLRWNVTERVQVFTNPFWLFIHVPFYYFTKEVFLTTIFISILLDIVTFWITIRLFKTRTSYLLVFLLVPLVLSKAFTEYATSGLENPLSFLFLALFYLTILRTEKFYLTILRTEKFSAFWFTFYCFLIAGLAGFNRLDSFIFYLPVLVYLFISQFSFKTLFAASLGLLPLILWEVFSVFYYGFLLPNTAYAKLSTGIVASGYMRQGIIYAIDLIQHDPISAVTISLAILFIVHAFYQSLIHRKIPTLEQFLGIGLLLYCVYIVKVGGDFMTGRFWSAPFFLSILLINGWLHNSPNLMQWYNLLPAISDKYIHGIVIGLGILVTIQALIQTQAETVLSSGIADEKRFYLTTNSLLKYIKYQIKSKPSIHSWITNGVELKQRAEKLKVPLVTATYVIGMQGFYAGPNVVFIDRFALGDPLLARLPIIDTNHWRIGHFERQIPEGYVEFQQTGAMEKMPPALAEYYKPLHYIIAGPLFDVARLNTIWQFNLGTYDHYLQQYLREIIAH